MRKLLFINGHMNVGGVEKSLLDILRHLDYERYEVELLLLEELGDYGPELPPQVRVRLRSLEHTEGPLFHCLLGCLRRRDWFSLRVRLSFLFSKLFGGRCLRAAGKLLTDGERYDCVIGFRSGICSRLAAFGVDAEKRVIWWHHGEFNVPPKQYEAAALRCDRVVAVSQSCADMLREELPAIAEKLSVVRNMVDTAYLEAKCAAGDPYGERSVPQLVTVCRLSPEKHAENVILAARQLSDAGFAFRWHIIGDGAQRRWLEGLSEENGTTDCVVFEGAKTNPYPYMRYAKLYVHPSYVESQGLTVLEAMALGTPCVVTASRGPCEFLDSGVNGLLTERSPEALAEGVARMLRDAGLYAAIKAGTSCPDSFEPARVMTEIERILN